MSLTGAGTMQDPQPSPTTTKFTTSALIQEMTDTIQERDAELERIRVILGARNGETAEQAATSVASQTEELHECFWRST
jgi:hypothetical protein